MSRDYTLTNVATTDGRLISGIIREQNDDVRWSIQTANERIVLPREDVEAIKPSTTSMMPEGQLEPLSPQEIRDLFAYLASTSQVPRRRAQNTKDDSASVPGTAEAASANQPAQRPDDVRIFGAVAGGDPDELAGLEALLVVAGPGVDPATDEQPADEVLGAQAALEARPGRSWRRSGKRGARRSWPARRRNGASSG